MAEEVAAAAQAAYEAYALAVGGRDPYQHPMEPYSDLHDIYKAAWEQAAMAAVGTVGTVTPTAASTPPGVAAPAAGAPATPAEHPPAAPPVHPPGTKADAEEEEGEHRPRGGRRA
jgi:hypothetical protein